MFKQRPQKGLHFPDHFLSSAKGLANLQHAGWDFNILRNQVEGIYYNLFPLRDKPVPGRPGYVTHERDYFKISHPDPKIEEALNEQFIDGYRVDEHFSGSHDLGDYLSSLARELIIEGKVFALIEWENNQKTKLVMPGYLMNMPTETMRVHKNFYGVIKGFEQKYSLWTYYTERRFARYGEPKKPRVYKFEANEVLYCKYPFSLISPVKQSLPMAETDKKLMIFGLHQSTASAQPENYYLPVEKARHKIYQTEKRKVDLINYKIAKIFNNLVSSTYLANVTEYYDVYTVIRYKKYLNDFRNFLVKEFNNQILGAFTEKNKLQIGPTLVYSGFWNNEDLEEMVKEFNEGKLTPREIGELITLQ